MDMDTPAQPTLAPRRTRGPWLTLWLVWIILGAGWTIYRNLSTYQDLEAHFDPNLPHWPFLAASWLNGVVVAGAVALLLWRKWGMLLCLAGTIGAYAAFLAAGVPVSPLQILGTLVTYGVLGALLYSGDRWGLFSWRVVGRSRPAGVR